MRAVYRGRRHPEGSCCPRITWPDATLPRALMFPSADHRRIGGPEVSDRDRSRPILGDRGRRQSPPSPAHDDRRSRPCRDRPGESVVADLALLGDIAAHLVNAGGKRVRPGFAIASAATSFDPARPVPDEVIAGATAVELVHIGSLYHDDVMDDAEIRRGVPSVNVAWGNHRAILAGDFLLARASEIAASLGTEVAGPAGLDDRPAVRRPDPRAGGHWRHRAGPPRPMRPRSQARPPRCWPLRAGSVG